MNQEQLSKRAAVFLDKDGTLIKDVPYNVDVNRIELFPDAIPALQRITDNDYELVIISNQSGVALGKFEEAELINVEAHLCQILREAGLVLSGFYYCPHHMDGSRMEYAKVCDCRKPRPGLLRRAAAELQLDLGTSWMVGDILNDVEAGRRAGCRTVLIDNGGETEWRQSALRTPDAIVRTLHDAAAHICGQQE